MLQHPYLLVELRRRVKGQIFRARDEPWRELVVTELLVHHLHAAADVGSPLVQILRGNERALRTGS